MALMRAMVLERLRTPLVMQERPLPQPAAGEVLIEVLACGVCRTDLHVVDGELPHPKLPIVPGHEIVGRVAALGSDVKDLILGARVGFRGWRSLWRLCLLPFGPREPVRHAEFHRLYPRRRLRHAYAGERRLLLRTGRQRRRCGNSTAPVCRPDRLAQLSHGGEGESLGLYGLAPPLILVQVAVWQGRDVYAFTRPGDIASQDFARRLGAAWAGGSTRRCHRLWMLRSFLRLSGR